MMIRGRRRHGMLWPASLGALGAAVLVLAIGAMARKPLSQVPENALKFVVGVMLSAFGLFGTGEGLGVSWPGQDLAILASPCLFLAVAGALIAVWFAAIGENGMIQAVLKQISVFSSTIRFSPSEFSRGAHAACPTLWAIARAQRSRKFRWRESDRR